MSVTDALTEAGFGMAWSASQRLPEPVVDRAFRAMADRTYRRNGEGVQQLRANLARVVPEMPAHDLDELTHRNLRLYMRYWSEVFRLPAWDRSRMRAAFTLDPGLDLLDAAVDAGRGAIMVSPHAGNWDLAGAWACDRYGSIVTVAERLRPEGLFDKFVAFRRSLGMNVLPLGGDDTTRALIRGLRAGQLVCLVTDRDLAGTGVPVDFFGQKASMPAGPAMLSLMTGAPIMPVRLWHEDGVVRAVVEPPLPVVTDGTKEERVRATTQAMADSFADAIRAHPADWHMLQPLWTSDAPPLSAAAARQTS